MRIGIDVDGVLANFIDSFLEFHNSYYGPRIEYEDFTHYHLADQFGISEAEEKTRMELFYNVHHSSNPPPVEGAQEAVEELSREHELVVVNARNPSLETMTREWLEEHFPGRFDKVVHTSEGFSDKAYEKKAAVCKENGLVLMVEDRLEYAEGCAVNNIPAILLEKPWNRNGEGDPDLVYRVGSWHEALEMISR